MAVCLVETCAAALVKDLTRFLSVEQHVHQSLSLKETGKSGAESLFSRDDICKQRLPFRVYQDLTIHRLTII